jgi:FkbM family methyltransferase
VDLFVTITLSLINLIFKKLTIEKIYKKLYINPHNIFVRIKSKHYSFLYRSVDFDDLNMMSRENLKYWESSSREVFSELSKESNTVFDIGAYTGIYSLIAAKSNKNLRVFSFEPNPELFNALTKNIKNNFASRCNLQQFALDKVSGNDYLYLNHDVYSSVGSLIETLPGQKKILIEKTTLDKFCQEKSIERIDLMKIDVEGFEVNVLEGGRTILSASTPLILMESLNNKSLEIQYEFLSSIDYLRPLQIKGDGYDRNNWLWFTKKHKSKILKLKNLLVL